MLQRLSDWYHGLTPFGATEGVGRIFLVCRDCRAVVPRWRVVRKRGLRKDNIGCPRCACIDSVPRTISELRAAYWVLFRGLLVRRFIQRHEDWEPRFAWRHTPADPS